MIKRSVVAIVLSTLISGVCNASEEVADDEYEPAVWTVNPNIFRCSPETLDPNGLLTLSLGPGHGRELAIHRESDNVFFFLVVKSPPSDMVSLMTPEQFSGISHLEIPASIEGHAWVAHRGREPVFTTPGTYAVYTSNALESEEGGFTCSIQYSGNLHAP